jgi:hypothetical protein
MPLPIKIAFWQRQLLANCSFTIPFLKVRMTCNFRAAFEMNKKVFRSLSTDQCDQIGRKFAILGDIFGAGLIFRNNRPNSPK